LLDNLDFEQLNLSSNSEKLTELKKDISQRDSDIRRRARELGYEYKGSGKILGTGNGVPQEAYKIRKYVLIHIIEHPELAKRGCFKAVWLEKYGHIMDYIDLTNSDLSKRDRADLTQLLKDKHMYTRTSLMRAGNYIALVANWYKMNKLREERDELQRKVEMLFSGDLVVLNGTVFTKYEDYYIGMVRGKQKRIRHGIFDKVIQLVEEL